MIGFVARRLLQIPFVLLAVAAASFVLVRFAPGGPFDIATNAGALLEVEFLRRCDATIPLEAQFADFLQSLATLDLEGCTGISLIYPGRPVREILAEALPVTARLAGLALLVSVIGGGSLGILASRRPRGVVDRVSMTLAVVGLSIPSFVLGPLLVLVFSLALGWLPPARWDGPATWVLPTLALAAGPAAYVARLVRGGLLDVEREEWVRAARAKGVPPWRVLFRHAMRGGIVPVVSYLGPAASTLLTGSVVVEVVFSLPGLGRTFVESALNRDYNVIQAAILVYALLVLLVNLVVDVVYGMLDPRVRVDA